MPKPYELNVARVSSTGEIDALPTDTAAVLVIGLDDHKIAALRRLNGLRVVYHAGASAITNEGLIELVVLPTLEVLDLQRSTEITDRGLVELRLLDNLRWLNLTRCSRLSEAAIEELRRALPRCEILR